MQRIREFQPYGFYLCGRDNVQLDFCGIFKETYGGGKNGYRMAQEGKYYVCGNSFRG